MFGHGFGIPEWAIGVGFIILAGSLGRALLGRRGPVDRPPKWKASRHELARGLEDLHGKLGELDDLHKRLGEVEDLQRRVGELEERVDFAERLLAKQREAERLAPPPNR